MARDNKVNMPSGQGGLTRYFDEYSSKIEISPTAVIILAVVIMALIIILHQVGGGFFG
ncbi:preprotein translocase subunit Sec61beta [Candidatus Woesearchaeota archaeon]|nr:preprotein translocase subunit Sec61beta [Candidatus Woesearchaeota archaeon]